MNGLFFGGLFWGILISLIGLSIVLKYGFHIEFPIVRIFIGLIIILFGLKMIAGYNSKANNKNRDHTRHLRYSNECDVVFSNGTIDLSSSVDGKDMPEEITVVFGSATVLVPDSVNLEVVSTTVFGTTILPDRSYAGFGEDRYVIKNNPNAPVFRIQTTTVFGRLVFEKVKTSVSGQTNNADSISTEPGQSY